MRWVADVVAWSLMIALLMACMLGGLLEKMVMSEGSSVMAWFGEWSSWLTSIMDAVGVDMLVWLRGRSG